MKTPIVLTVALFLTACAAQSTPPQTLDQKLSGQSATERKETLRLACLNEAEWPATLQKTHTSGRFASRERMRAKETPEINEMKSLCRQMDDLTSPDVEEKMSPQILANSCAEKVANMTAKGNTAHAVRSKQICEKMIGKKVLVQ